jgi:hypothetical protein
MELKLSGKIVGLTNADLDNLEKSEERISNATKQMSAELIDEVREAKLNRLVRFCQSGRLE